MLPAESLTLVIEDVPAVLVLPLAGSDPCSGSLAPSPIRMRLTQLARR